MWVIGAADSPATAPTYFSLVNGSTTDFSHPFGMTIWGNPGHELFPQIKVEHLTGNPADVPANQLWAPRPAPRRREQGYRPHAPGICGP